jgi:hypothetical protein
MAKYAHIGKGKVYLGKVGEQKRRISPSSRFAVVADVEKKELPVWETGGGGNEDTLERINNVTIELNLHNLSPENVGLALFGSATAITAGAVSAEAHVAHHDGLVLFDFLPDESQTITITGSGGSPTHTVDVDYTIEGSGIVPIAGGGITDGSTIEASYTKLAGDAVEALLSTGDEFELILDGVNEAKADRKFNVHAFRFKPSAGQRLELIGDDFAGMPISGEVLRDSSKTGSGVSQFLKANFALAA